MAEEHKLSLKSWVGGCRLRRGRSLQAGRQTSTGGERGEERQGGRLSRAFRRKGVWVFIPGKVVTWLSLHFRKMRKEARLEGAHGSREWGTEKAVAIAQEGADHILNVSRRGDTSTDSRRWNLTCSPIQLREREEGSRFFHPTPNKSNLPDLTIKSPYTQCSSSYR